MKIFFFFFFFFFFQSNHAKSRSDSSVSYAGVISTVN
ncbi:hypothetical protein PFMALIP_00816 [Plasmodium falciparum MaliPS096_E11]|uniref:Uncharacterized protein n=1 Tax=Plasmodium falciparum MaliPS096_E11 TaxID=1036727 RepID=A0A024WV76_PLAFA|nr:hypothetical protein PFMALIP_00816 [Plasmodium falciparum MaliPS096_E11]